MNLTWQTVTGVTRWQRFISAAVQPLSHRLRPSAGRLEIRKWTTRNSNFLQVGEILAFVKTDEQRSKVFPGSFWIGVAADHELLLQMELDLNPGAGTFTDFVPGTAALGDQPSRPRSLAFSRSSSMSLVNLIEYRSTPVEFIKSSPVSLFVFRSAAF